MKTTISSTNSKISKHRGFSLVEMLVVIAVIGIIAAIAVPILSSIKTQAGQASHQRSANMIANMATSAMAAGNLDIPAASSVDEVVDLLVAGVNGTGAFEGTMFQIHNLSPEDRIGVVSKLGWNGGVLSNYH